MHTTSSPAGAQPGDALPVRVECLADGHVLRIVLHGECDFAMTDDLDRALNSVELERGHLVRLDLTPLQFADVATIRCLAAFVTHARTTGHDVLTSGARPTVRKVADLLGIGDVLGLC